MLLNLLWRLNAHGVHFVRFNPNWRHFSIGFGHNQALDLRKFGLTLLEIRRLLSRDTDLYLSRRAVPISWILFQGSQVHNQVGEEARHLQENKQNVYDCEQVRKLNDHVAAMIAFVNN